MINSVRNDSPPRQPLAIVGIGCRLPGGVVDVESYWDLLKRGRSAIVEVPKNRWNRERYYHENRAIPGRMVTKWGGFVDNLDRFDAAFWGISPREALRMDPQQRWLLEVSWEAIEDAGIAPQDLRGSEIGVYVGIASNDYAGLQMLNWDETDVHTNSGSTLSIASNRISFQFDFKGPSISIDTACSSALVAMSQACHAVWSGQCEAVLTGGVNALITPHASIGFSKAAMLSPSGRCWAFDARADGYARGEGAAMVLIKPLERAVSDGDPIYAVVRAAVVNQDGHTSSMTVPSVEGQSAMLRQAYREAGIEPGRVCYMEAHGTGTPVGDPIEAAALGSVLGDGRPAGEKCLIGSVKTNLGHLESASGVAGLIKAALVLRHDTVPPSLNFEKPNPNIPFERLRLQVATNLQPLPHQRGHTPVAAVNSFGFGGTNAHIVLEAAPLSGSGNSRSRFIRNGSKRRLARKVDKGRGTTRDSTAGTRAQRPCLLPISARDDESLRAYVQAYHDFLADTALSLPDVCCSAGQRKEHHTHRLVVMGQNALEMRERMSAWLSQVGDVDGIMQGRSTTEAGTITFVFTGQGAHWWKMGRELLNREPIFCRTLEHIDNLLEKLAGWSLIDEMTQPTSEERSNIHRTSIAQPALFALQVGLFDLWRSWGIQPAKVIGHSVGEVAAAYCAGILTLDDAVKVIYHRSRLQDSASGDGRMLAAGISAAEARDAIGEFTDRVQLAAINSPTLVTLAGDREPLEQIHSRLKDQGQFTTWLRINYAFHTHHMDAIKEELLDALADIRPRPGRMTFISTVTGGMMPGEKLDATYWWRNVRQPVLFAPALSNLVQAGERAFVELGPHPALEGAINEILAEQGKHGQVFHSLKRETDETSQILANLCGLHNKGTRIDWAAVNQSAGTFVRLPQYPWNYKSYWLEAEGMARQRLAANAHPLLGQRQAAAEPTWQFKLDPRLLTYLADHSIWESMIFPAAGYCEIGLAVARELFPGEPYVVEELQIRNGLFYSEDKLPTVQIVVNEVEKSFRVYGSASDTKHWELHAQGRLVLYTAVDDREGVDLASIRQRLSRTIDHDEYYKDFADAGYQFGPNFQQIQKVWRVEGESLAEIDVPESILSTIDEYHFHPAVLDACFQAFKAVRLRGDASATDQLYVPVSIRRIRPYRDTSPARLWAHAKRLFDDYESVVTDIFVYDSEGRRVADILGFRAERVKQSRGDGVESCYYQFRWAPCRLRGRGLDESCQFPDPQELVEVLRAEVPAVYHQHHLGDYFNDFAPRMEQIVQQYIENACVELGWEPREGDRFTQQDFVKARGIVQTHRRLATAELRALELKGTLKRLAEDEWEVVQRPAKADVSSSLGNLIRQYPRFATEAELVRTSCPRLASVLTGKANPLELLFPGGSSELLERFYTEATDFPAQYKLFEVAVRKAVEALPTRALRVLEVGAGTGSLTRHILPVLPADRTEFRFTDIGPAFLATAKKRFAAFPFVDYQIFDVEKDPKSQELQPHGFDLILASNVLHATKDLKQTLSNLRSCLASNALFIFLEVVNRRATWDNIFGLLPGWWRFTDTDLRRESALLGRRQWEALLADCGFHDVQSFNASGNDDEAEHAALISVGPELGQAHGDPRDKDQTGTRATFLLFADRGGVADRLADRLQERGDQVIVVRARSEFRQTSPAEFDVAADAEEDLRRVFASQTIAEADMAGIIHCWSLDHPSAQQLTPGELLAAQNTGVLCALGLVRALSDAEFASTPRVHFVTRDVQGIVQSDAAAGVASAPIIGLARVANNEHPQFRWTVVDLAKRDSTIPLDDSELRDLLDEIVIGDDELEVAWRDSRRYARRLARVQFDQLPKLTRAALEVDERPVPYRVQTDKPGVLANLSLNETRRRDPGPDEIEVLVQAGGINFRDVMKALGMYPGNPVDRLWFGDDFAGRVLRVGENVQSIRPGHAVVGIAPYAFRAYLTVDHRMVFKMPSWMSFEEAATLPTVFLTSHYAIQHMARMQPGEKILIHAGMGGVGQAAIQVAQRLGLEIFATAGTPEKRNMLCQMGVPHAMNSRTLEFADQVMEVTGGRGVDAVLNSLAGEFIPKSLSLLAPFGRFLEIGKTDIYNNSKIGLEALKHNVSYFVIDLAQHLTQKPAYVASLFQELSERFEAGDYKPLPHTVFPITEVVDAFRFMAQGKHIGKNVVSFQTETLSIGPCTDQGHLLRPDASYLITGGAGGFGLELAKWMATQGARHLVLMSRSGPPDDDSRAAIRRLRDDGVTIVDARGDVTNCADVDRVVKQIQDELPPLRGIFHGAMMLDDDYLVTLNKERFNHVLHPKVLGAWNLHTSTRHLPLEHFVCFSSFSTVIGGVRQSNYNAANSFLDALAHYRRRLGLPALTYNWGALLGAGFVERNRKTAQYLDKVGMKALTIEEALEVFGCMMLLDPIQIGASRMDWQSVAKLSPLVARSNTYAELAREASTSESGGAIQARVLAACPDERRTLLEAFLTEQVAGVFGIEPDKVDRETSLTHLGLDSLMSVDLMTRIKSGLGLNIPMGSVLRGPNLVELAEILSGMIADSVRSTHGDGREAGADSAALVPLEKTASTRGEFPLSEGQQALWYLYRLAPDSSAYNLTFGANFTPHIDIGPMKKAFASLFERHPMLDVVFSDADGEPIQRQCRGRSIDFREHDASQLDQQQVHSLLARHANQPFDLEAGPVVRLELFRTQEGHISLLCMHHIISDAWSITVLIKDLIESYFTIKAGRSPQFDQQGFSYEDFVAWEHKHLQSEAGQRMGQYWRKHLEGAPPRIELPTDRPRPAMQTYHGATHGFKLDDELTHGVLQLAAEQNVTLFTLLLSAYSALLHRRSQQQDIVIGVPMAGRKHREFHGTIGYFINPVPMRSQVDDDPVFRDFLCRNQEQLANALDNQQYPLKRLVNDLQVPRDPGRSPLFQVAFSMERIPGFDEQGIAVFLIGQGGHIFRFGEMQAESLDVTLRQAQFDIMLVVEEAGGNIYGCWQYNCDLFDADTIADLSEAYADVLRQLVRDPSLRISELTVPTQGQSLETGHVATMPAALAADDGDWLQRIHAWNRTERPLENNLPLHERIEQQAARTPNNVAVVCGEAHLTYRELNERANCLAHYLRSIGVAPDARVGICMGRGIDLIVAIQGVLKAGAAYVPMDAKYPQHRLETIARTAGMTVVITREAHRVQLGSHCGRLVCLDTDWNSLAQHASSNPEPLAGPKNLAYVIYTSGSTGEPKGVGVYHAGLTNLVNWFLRDFAIGETDRSLVITSHGFDLTQKNLHAALMVGGQVHLSTCGDYDPDHILREIDESQITLLNCTPSHFYALVDDPDRRRLAQLNSIRTLFLGGEPIDMTRLAAWRNREGFATELVNTYGPTECTDICSFYRVAPQSDETEIPVGTPIDNVRTYLLNADLAPVPPGVTGELCIVGAGVGAGYINDADLTAARFVPNPFHLQSGELLYRTGDLCRYRHDGAIEFIGRVDDQVKIRGFRVELGEIESDLRIHPAVQDAVVVAREDARNSKRLIAFLIQADGQLPNANDIQEFLRHRLPDHMVPTDYVILEAFPLTPHGKIDRQALRTRDLDGNTSQSGAPYVAPRDEIETFLAEVWQDVLGVDRIGVLDSFFDLGGDSLSAVELVVKIRRKIGVNVPLAMMLQGDSVAQMATHLRRPQDSAWSPLIPIQPHGSQPPLFLIHPIGGNVLCYSHLIDSLGNDQPVFGIQARGVDGAHEPAGSIDEMACEYVEAIRTVQSTGPYFLAGWSFGGVIAYEMAQRIKADGEDIGMIAIFDSRVPALMQIDVDDEAAILSELIGFLNQFYQAGIELSYDALQSLDSESRLRLVLDRVQQVALLPVDFSEEYARRFLNVSRAHLRAIAGYHPIVSDVPLVLFRAADSPDTSQDPAATGDLGWHDLVGDLTVETVPGNHVTMLADDQARRLAQLLSRRMSQGELSVSE